MCLVMGGKEFSYQVGFKPPTCSNVPRACSSQQEQQWPSQESGPHEAYLWRY